MNSHQMTYIAQRKDQFPTMLADTRQDSSSTCEPATDSLRSGFASTPSTQNQPSADIETKLIISDPGNDPLRSSSTAATIVLPENKQ